MRTPMFLIISLYTTSMYYFMQRKNNYFNPQNKIQKSLVFLRNLFSFRTNRNLYLLKPQVFNYVLLQ